jgi:4-diphosphocytidyl-2-C-methyl-D-erythritol kinase
MSLPLKFLAPAKLNLFLELKSKRPDGFHELETVMCCVNLCDHLTFKNRDDGQVYLRDVNVFEGLPPTGDNLITRALELLKSETNCQSGMQVELEKRIPIQAGLGGASSDAATALCAGNQIWNLGLGKEKLYELAAELGSDVPFFITGGTAVCKGRGEIVQPMGILFGYSVLIAKPPVGFSTPKIFSHCTIPSNPRSSDELIAALRAGDRNLIRSNMINRLEPAAAKVSDWVNRMSQAFEKVNCIAHQLSGSGSCYFGLFGNRKLLRKASAKLLQREPDVALYCCQAIGRLAHQSLGRE